MMQQNWPNARHQVIYMGEEPKEKVNIRDAYNVKAATVLGVIHTVCGVIALGSEIVWGNAGQIWISVLFFVSGGVSFGGARCGNKSLVVASMAMAIISALAAGILTIVSAIHLTYVSIRLVVMGAMMLGITIASASLTSYPPLLFFDQPEHRLLQSQLVGFKCPCQSQLQPQQPPDYNYHEVAGTSSSYQKF